MKKLICLYLFSITILSSMAQLPSNVPTGSLVAYWPFTGNANDLSGNGNHGTLNNVTLTNGRNGSANSAYEYVSGSSITTNTLVPCWGVNNSQNMTVSAWVRTTENNSRQEIVQWGAGTTNNDALTLHLEPGGKVRCDLTNEVGPYSDQPVNDGNWHFVAVTITNGTARIYVDGQASQETHTFSPIITCGPFNIGRYVSPNGTTYQFLGSIDEVAIYSRSLAPCEIRRLGGFPFAPATPTFVNTPAANVCSGPPVVYSVNPVPEAISYIWRVDGINQSNPTTTHSEIWLGSQPGNHTVWVNAVNVCTSSPALQANITVTTKPTVTITGTNSLCANQQIQLAGAPIGGTWTSSNTAVATVDASGFLTGLVEGTTTITYTVVNGPCTTSSTKVITVNNPLSFEISGLTTVCPGGSNYTYTPTPTTLGASYTWRVDNSNATLLTPSPTSTVLSIPTSATGSFHLVCVGKNGCGYVEVTQTIQISTHVPPIPNLTCGTPTSTNDCPLLTVSNNGSHNIHWNIGGVTQTGGTSANREAGKNVTVTYTNSTSGCSRSATRNSTTVNCTSMRLAEEEELSIDKPFLIYPNPAKGVFAIQTQGQSGIASISDVTGQVIRQVELLEGKNLYNVEMGTAGVYLIRIKSGNETKGYKIVVE